MAQGDVGQSQSNTGLGNMAESELEVWLDRMEDTGVPVQELGAPPLGQRSRRGLGDA